MHPDIEPYDKGLLPVGARNAIYWECCGNPNGTPALYVHGGPGSGCTPSARRYFDPKTYRVVLIDQRGCGRSKPLVAGQADLNLNTTQHLIGDIEAVRRHLSIDRWLVLGISWGTTLALAYAQTHPDNVTALILACVTATSRREVDWLTRGVGSVFPQEWERFASHVPDALRSISIVDAYASLLSDDDPVVSARAAEEWCAWEEAHVSRTPGYAPNPRFLDLDFKLRFARIVTHYWRRAAFLKNQLLRGVSSLRAIRSILIHGVHDVSSPPETARQLHERWPQSRLELLDDAGHGGGSMPARIVCALEEFGEFTVGRA